MRLTRVTITGADDGVPYAALQELGAAFPFVEFGLLLSPSRFGTPRYPSTRWMADLIDHGLVERCSYHVCGEFSRRVMGGDPQLVPRGIRRMQINGFSKYRLPCLLAAEGAPDVEFILQCQTGEALAHAAELRQQHPNVVALWDPSGGQGRWFAESGTWYPWGQGKPTIPIGYAGGINELNIEDTIAQLSDSRGEPFWIDLESGARTDDKFDLEKVTRLLKLAAPFVIP